MITLWILLCTITLSWGLTTLMRRYALARALFDIPNARSSHVVPTPRGGGVAIVISFLLAIAAAWLFTSSPDSSLLVALLGAGSGVALLGFLDDHGHIPARWRLLGHFIAAAWVLAWIPGISPAQLIGLAQPFPLIDPLLAALFLVWMLNLYNFMDGIDGIAGSEAMIVGLGGATTAYLAGHHGLALVSLLLTAASAGFLIWNFPPARIFMGDAGSGFLGLIVGALALHAGTLDADLFWSWLIMAGVFVADATLTLLRRLLRGERVHEAHRSHAYQHAARHYGRHLPVTLAVSAIGLGWLLPIATAVALGILPGWVGVLIAYAPLLFLAHRFDAGIPEQDSPVR